MCSLALFKLFKGPSEFTQTPVTSWFSKAVDASFIRITPIDWISSLSSYDNPCLRFEVLGCAGNWTISCFASRFAPPSIEKALMFTTWQACADDRSKIAHKYSKMSQLLNFITIFGTTVENALQ